MRFLSFMNSPSDQDGLFEHPPGVNYYALLNVPTNASRPLTP
jgi:hypothetical protein